MLISHVTAFIRVSALTGIDAFAETQKLALDGLLEAVDLPSDILQHAESLIPYRKFSSLLSIATQRSNNPLFGLQFGLHQGVSALGPMYYMICNAPTVGDALQELSRYFHLHSSSSRLRVTFEGELALFHYDADDVRHAPSQRIVTELVAGTATHLMRSLLGHLWQPKALMLRHAPACAVQTYQRLLGITPQFNAPYDAWLFDAKLLQVPLGGGDPKLRKLIQQHLDNLDRMAMLDLPNYVCQLLRDQLPEGRTSIEQIARQMDLGPRTLQRYLADEGTSFQQLLDETRQSLAQRYLTDSTLNLTHLAALLGYSELSAFTRAFSRWFGVSPKQWRTQQLNNTRKPPNSLRTQE